MFLFSAPALLYPGLLEGWALHSISKYMCMLWLSLLSRFVCLFPHHAEYNKAIRNYTHFDDWYLWVQMYKGTVSMPVFQSLEAYWPGLQVGHIRE